MLPQSNAALKVTCVSLDGVNPQRLRAALAKATAALLGERNDRGFWDGELSSSALSTATAVTAFALALKHRAVGGNDAARLQRQITAGLKWLAEHQNANGGWGDTTKSLSNISTTTLCWAAFGACEADDTFGETVTRAEAWLNVPPASRWRTHSDPAREKLAARSLAERIIARYGKDRTFSVPILTMCALAGRLGTGPDAWRDVIPLPFELAALPHQFFAALRLPVVSYALPALIAIGLARHVHAPSSNPLVRWIRNATRQKTLRVLTDIQPSNGGFLEATPLTSFVTMSLAASGEANHVVAQRGLEFLIASQRTDGSWPIDTNLSTWCTTLSLNALDRLFGEHLYDVGLFERGLGRAFTAPDALRNDEQTVIALVRWLLDQQHRTVHPYTHAAPGGWAWTDLPGGVPDADDTAGAIIALDSLQHGLFDADSLASLGMPEFVEHIEEAKRAGMRWLLGLQNRDGGFPTFCRGWGALPFDQSSPDITAHAIRALASEPDWQHAERTRAIERATRFLVRSQRNDGSWVPLWFGNQFADDDQNPIYGTSRVLLGLEYGIALASELVPARRRGVAWLCAAQNRDGSWGGDGLNGTIEETALAVEALATMAGGSRLGADIQKAIAAGAGVLINAVESGAWREPAPIGFYFAKLWYFEKLYPLIFTVGALRSVSELTPSSES